MPMYLERPQDRKFLLWKGRSLGARSVIGPQEAEENVFPLHPTLGSVRVYG